MFYTSRIRPTVLSRWAEVKAAYPGSNDAQDLAEGEPLSENGVFRDVTIPISYKNAIAQELWDAEDEGIKKQVWARRETDPGYKTVYNTDGQERLELVREYSK